jgi:hypothetical protein
VTSDDIRVRINRLNYMLVRSSDQAECECIEQEISLLEALTDGDTPAVPVPSRKPPIREAG